MVLIREVNKLCFELKSNDLMICRLFPNNSHSDVQNSPMAKSSKIAQRY